MSDYNVENQSQKSKISSVHRSYYSANPEIQTIIAYCHEKINNNSKLTEVLNNFCTNVLNTYKIEMNEDKKDQSIHKKSKPNIMNPDQYASFIMDCQIKKSQTQYYSNQLFIRKMSSIKDSNRRWSNPIG